MDFKKLKDTNPNMKLISMLGSYFFNNDKVYHYKSKLLHKPPKRNTFSTNRYTNIQ